MLPFMKDQEPPGASGEGMSANNHLMSGQPLAQQEAYYTVADRSQSVRNMTIFIAVLFVIGLIGLFLMVKKCRRQAVAAAQATTDETQIEVAITRLTGVSSEMMDRMDKIVNKFYEFSDVLQVSVGELAKNPFELETFASDIPDNEDVQDASDEYKVLQQKLKLKAEALELLSIIQSEQGHRCMINDQILRVNDSIKDFRIIKIAENRVVLQWESEELDVQGTPSQHCNIVLKLSE